MERKRGRKIREQAGAPFHRELAEPLDLAGDVASDYEFRFCGAEAMELLLRATPEEHVSGEHDCHAGA